MATKEQERKALEKIRKIIDELGEDSYIGLAFIGCIDDAETNIENDWGCSNYDRWQTAEQRYEHCRAEKEEIEAENKQLKDRAEKAEQLFNLKVESATKWNALYNETSERATAAEKEIETLKNQIITLKAKLYDMITAQG